MPPIKAADIPFGSAPPKPVLKERIFRERGEQRYSLEVMPAGIVFEVDRLRRHSQELWGELTVTVNGTLQRVPHGANVLRLLAILGIDPARVAVERNLDVVRRATYAETILADGDRIEIVTFVGGG